MKCIENIQYTEGHIQGKICIEVTSKSQALQIVFFSGDTFVKKQFYMLQSENRVFARLTLPSPLESITSLCLSPL